ncbi:hypothetical protein PMAYCL1PPCAC_21391 [Pristionchus mayeri]|uniref:Uncharacterized protein n=1 Tax=Pristionchus mayeri TaxID=1317129 RepID=A0AAN5I588_9BILA|nr:hypothetical protein PMAYCL1PPCAC_21391 [Pristionchus mayeri]
MSTEASVPLDQPAMMPDEKVVLETQDMTNQMKEEIFDKIVNFFQEMRDLSDGLRMLSKHGMTPEIQSTLEDHFPLSGLHEGTLNSVGDTFIKEASIKYGVDAREVANLIRNF